MIPKKIQLYLLFLSFIFVIAFFYFPFIFQGKLPIPADTIIGLYHPFRDLYAVDFPNGIPFKNFLITDPVRQLYIWKELAIEEILKGTIPVWNPYEMAGKPLIGNFQSSIFYPLNLIFLLKPFSLAWGYFILLQTFLSGIFMYFYLRSLGLFGAALIFGSLAFSFSGFMVAWLEWGTVGHTALWLPLILLSIDKMLIPSFKNNKFRLLNSGRHFKVQSRILWFLVFAFSLMSSFFAGHLQTFFYVMIFSLIYLIARWIQFGRQIKILFTFLLFGVAFLLSTAIQWIPTLKFILLSARISDQSYVQQEGWFLPWEHLIQFIAPDFFGNPTTLNYWGVWNYAEFIGYVGILTLVFVFIAVFNRRDKRTLFFLITALTAFVFALPNFISKIPFVLSIPFISTAQPTRLIFIVSFSLAVLSALGLDYYLRHEDRSKLKMLFLPIGFVALALLGLWVLVLVGPIGFFENIVNISVAKRNLFLPTVLMIFGSTVLVIGKKLKSKRVVYILLLALVAVSVFDQLRFANKFTPFTKAEYLFPQTKVLDFLRQQEGVFRISSLDQRILPPNFATNYRLQSIEGYDPLYLRNYAEYIAALERDEPNIDEPFGFNRIITPHNFRSQLYDFLNVKYVLSLVDIESEKLLEVFREGETRIYENKNVLPRVFFVEKVVTAVDSQESIQKIFQSDLSTTAIIISSDEYKETYSKGKVELVSYSPDKIILKTINSSEGFLVMSDAFYPTWKVTIDGQECIIIKTNIAFRGIVVPKGEHEIIFSVSLF